ncbi:DoxX family protein [Streptomyces kanamyceticus]|uniref:DoxX family protein n=1 Tax=Streptomyces kanamyceticus TaxID=1967 RepID=A0A5J6GIY8_STRKN|nr:DoxX family protein [Streptomyces kanamyceticus]QEU95057.1 DoxX family protein [Streptomyces kanamyceticus]
MATTATTVAAATGTTTASPARGRVTRIALRTLQVLFAVFFGVASGVPKLIAHPTAVESFDKLGWGAPGMYTIGALELLGGIALLIPLLSSLAATAFVGLMIGAFIVTVTALGGENAATPLVLIPFLAWIAWARRDRTVELIARLRARS